MSKVEVQIPNSNFAHTNIFCNCLVLFIAQVEVGRGKKRWKIQYMLQAGAYRDPASGLALIILHWAIPQTQSQPTELKKRGTRRKKN